MRGVKGKLVCIWSPVLHGEGCSTLSCSVGFGMHHFSGKKVLILNKSNSISHMEKYLEKDIEIKYSLDNLKIFNKGISADHILTYATQVNTGLYMLGGSRFNRELTKEDTDFDRLFIECCLEGFDLVIADMDTGVRKENRLYLDQADTIIAVFTPNEIIMDELFRNEAMQSALTYFTDKKTVSAINKLYDGWDTGSVTGRYKGRYSLSRIFGFNYDGDVINACCMEKDLYSFLMKELKRGKGGYVKQLHELCSFLISELCIEEAVQDSISYGGVFRRLLRSSIQ
ncbi:MAG TPA: hypothetical protein VEG39_10350 [Clostridia bacterium]|nr:hypothetical protein [Clostridia bacterium]